MAEKYDAGVYQQENGQWIHRFSIPVDGKGIARKKTTDEYGNKLWYGQTVDIICCGDRSYKKLQKISPTPASVLLENLL